MIKQYPKFQFSAAPRSDILAEVVAILQIPTDYENFLRTSNGGYGFIGEDYAILTKVEDMLPQTLNIESASSFQESF